KLAAERERIGLRHHTYGKHAAVAPELVDLHFRKHLGHLQSPCVERSRRTADHLHDISRCARVGGLAAENDLAALEHVQRVRVFRNMVNVGLRYQDAVAKSANRGDAFADDRNDRRREAFERLVEQQQLWIERKCASDRYHLAFATRKLVATTPGI